MVEELTCVDCGTETINGIGQNKECDCYGEELIAWDEHPNNDAISEQDVSEVKDNE